MPVSMMVPLKVRRSTMAAQSRGSVKVLVQPEKDSLEAMAITPNHRAHQPEALSHPSHRRSPLPGWLEICGSKKHMKLLDPRLSDLTPAHISIAWRYRVVRTLVDFGAAVCFGIGSAFFFFARTTTAADWLFLVGSILFAFKPTIDVARSMHLNRLPGQSDGPSQHTPASAGGGS